MFINIISEAGIMQHVQDITSDPSIMQHIQGCLEEYAVCKVHKQSEAVMLYA